MPNSRQSSRHEALSEEQVPARFRGLGRPNSRTGTQLLERINNNRYVNWPVGFVPQQSETFLSSIDGNCSATTFMEVMPPTRNDYITASRALCSVDVHEVPGADLR
jgi:hypothetical protein